VVSILIVIAVASREERGDESSAATCRGSSHSHPDRSRLLVESSMRGLFIDARRRALGASICIHLRLISSLRLASMLLRAE
jgi:hypothetical protein